jgi:ankyrin repeat protein
LSFLSLHNLRSFGITSTHNQQLMQGEIIRRAKDYGYGGDDFHEAEAHINELFQEIEAILTDGKSKWGVEAIANNLKSHTKDQIYRLYNYSPEKYVSFIHLTQYFLKIVKSHDFQEAYKRPEVASAAITNIALMNHNNTLLIYAISKNAIKVVELLLLIGVDPNIKNRAESPPLLLAALLGYDTIINLLLDHGAKVNELGKNRMTALCCALMDDGRARPEAEIKKTMSILLERGADLNLAEVNGSAPLHFAAQRGLHEVVNLLIDKGAQINARGAIGKTALCWTIGTIPSPSLRPQEMVKKTVTFLLENGADPNMSSNNGDAPLHYAAELGFDEVVNLLLDKGARINDVNHMGFTPLSWSISSGTREHYPNSEETIQETVHVLLERGADPNIPTANQRTVPLQYAALAGFNEIIRLLCARGADIHATCSEGKTAVYYAGAAKQKDTVRLLLSYGASLEPLIDLL